MMLHRADALWIINLPAESTGTMVADSRVTLYTAGHLHTAVPHCSHSRAPIVHTAVPRENNEHGCVYLRCRAVCKLPGCVEGHPWDCWIISMKVRSYARVNYHGVYIRWLSVTFANVFDWMIYQRRPWKFTWLELLGVRTRVACVKKYARTRCQKYEQCRVQTRWRRQQIMNPPDWVLII